MTSSKTNQQIKRILDKYLSKTDQIDLFMELSKVEGNKSFTATIENIFKLIHANKREGLPAGKIDSK